MAQTLFPNFFVNYKLGPWGLSKLPAHNTNPPKWIQNMQIVGTWLTRYKRGADSGSQIIGSAKKAWIYKSWWWGSKSTQIAARWICFTAGLKYHPYLRPPTIFILTVIIFTSVIFAKWHGGLRRRLIPYGAAWSSQPLQYIEVHY